MQCLRPSRPSAPSAGWYRHAARKRSSQRCERWYPSVHRHVCHQAQCQLLIVTVLASAHRNAAGEDLRCSAHSHVGHPARCQLVPRLGTQIKQSIASARSCPTMTAVTKASDSHRHSVTMGITAEPILDVQYRVVLQSGVLLVECRGSETHGERMTKEVSTMRSGCSSQALISAEFHVRAGSTTQHGISGSPANSHRFRSLCTRSRTQGGAGAGALSKPAPALERNALPFAMRLTSRQ